ncbi:MAG TPA: PTS sugar transporter subunit IIA [Clostridiaceae bacterium]
MDVAVTDLFSPNRVIFELSARTKKGVISELVDELEKDGILTEKAKFLEEVYKREEESSTGIGLQIAIPHGKSDAVLKASLVFGKSSTGIEFDSLDKEKVKLFFLIAVPENSDEIHLHAIASICRLLMYVDIREKLKKVNRYEDLIEIFNLKQGDII